MIGSLSVFLPRHKKHELTPKPGPLQFHNGYIFFVLLFEISNRLGGHRTLQV